MSRLVKQVGPPAPPRPNVLLTFEELFTDPDALQSGRWGLEGYTWMYQNDVGTPEEVGRPGGIQQEMRATDGTWKPITRWPEKHFMEDVYSNGQTTINFEEQFYCPEYLRVQFGVEQLNVIENGVLTMRAIQTPEPLKDIAITGADTYGDYPVIAVDRAAREITVSGRRYQRFTTAEDGSYARGNYQGFNRYFRDELVGDPPIDAHWKRRQYDYAWIRVQASDGTFVKCRYDRVIDSPAVDPPEGTPTTHRIRLQPGQLTEAQWDSIEAGGVLKLFRRLPWTSQMITTLGTFAQHYGVFEIVFKKDHHRRQFSAAWMWGNNCDMYRPKDGIEFIKFDDTWTNATEWDLEETPGGARGFRRVHNVHAAGVGGMQDYAARNGIDPVMPQDSPQFNPERDNAEWDKDLSCGHTIGITDPAQLGSHNYDEWTRLRGEWIPPNTAENPRPIGVVKWYVGPENGVLSFICGTITPPWWDSDPGAPKALQFNPAVGGNFVNPSNEIYDVNGTIAENGDEIQYQIKSVKAWQWPNEVAGGAGNPDNNFEYSRGMLPTPGDSTGNSGTGVVKSDGTAGGVQGGNEPVITDPLPEPEPTSGDPASYVPDNAPGIRYHQGQTSGRIVFELEDVTLKGRWNYDSYAGVATVVGTDTAPTLILDMHTPDTEFTTREVYFEIEGSEGIVITFGAVSGDYQ